MTKRMAKLPPFVPWKTGCNFGNAGSQLRLVSTVAENQSLSTQLHSTAFPSTTISGCGQHGNQFRLLCHENTTGVSVKYIISSRHLTISLLKTRLSHDKKCLYAIPEPVPRYEEDTVKYIEYARLMILSPIFVHEVNN